MLFLIILLLLGIGGRWACSWICPLGIIEELLYKIPLSKKMQSLPYDKQLRKIKYVIFFLLLIFVPLVFMPNKERLHGVFLFLKIFGFSTIFVLSLFVYRPFCKYLCPFGVFLGFFNKISPFRYRIDSCTCNKCSLCMRKCKMGVTPYLNPNDMECIRCGKCILKCPRKALIKTIHKSK